jgi:hypothetical protein
LRSISILTAAFVSALIAAPACSKAAPRTIDDCEKIQAADAYNQCLALFGPVARGHLATAGGDGLGPEVTSAKAHADVAPEKDLHHARHLASRHAWTRHSFARHGHLHTTKAAWHRHAHGKRTAMLFSVVSGHTRLR